MRFNFTSPQSLIGVGRSLLLVITVLSQSSVTLAGTTLKQVQISNGSQIDLLFDGKIQKNQIRTEFFNDIIQLSVQDVSVYPAKISSVNGGSLTKIFAYQYAPKLVRCRLTVKGKAESYKEKFDFKVSGKVLTIHVDGIVAGTNHEQAAVHVAPVPAGEGSHGSGVDFEERALLSRVLAAEAQPQHMPAAKVPRDSITLSAASPSKVDEVPVASTENLPIHSSTPKLAGARPLPSPMKAFGKMAAVLGIFGIFALALKRFSQSKADAKLTGQSGNTLASANSPGVFGALSRFAKKGLARNGKMIEVLSTHYLGPKKSIAVVRVAGRMLVLGVSNDSINLITQLSGDESDPLGGIDGFDLGGLGIGPTALKGGAGATAAGNAVFADLLSTERSKPSMTSGAGAYAAKAPASSASRTQARPNQSLGSGPSLGGNAASQYARSGALQASRSTEMQEPVVAGSSANSLSSVRAQIRNRLEGLKQL